MTDKALARAKEIKDEISELTHFIQNCRNCWKWLWIRKAGEELKVRTAYGTITDEIKASKALSDKMLQTIEEHINKLQQEFDSL